MIGPRALPLAGLAIVAAAMVGMLVAGIGFWLVLAVGILWAGSLWLAQPGAEVPAVRIDADLVSRDAASEALEPLGVPLLIVERGRIVTANAMARTALGGHIVGQDARVALRHPDAMALLQGADGDSVTIPDMTGPRTLWQLTHRRIDAKRWAIELLDRTAEADVGRAHTDFVANASHELRTPLSSIIGYTETLADPGQDVDPATRKRFLDTVLREARRMLALVEDLMSLSRVEAEKHDRPSDPVDLAQLAARVVAEIATVRGANRLVLQASDAVPAIPGDALQIEQLLRNLIDNAIKYGADDVPVEISVSADGNRVSLAVRDHGPGIAPEHLPLLTRRFYRTDPGRSRASGGTGLGLAIVKHIVERHHAELEIASPPGAGTLVTVSFPFRDAG